ncbi:MAG TPA: gamma-glutamyltransferase [Longimicrobiaceae bacterium]|nr:gamma-glutamyltransferase [Longimicrobiaceae bacterium]
MSNETGSRTGRPPTFAPRAMVAAPHYLATSAGLDVLRRGGSAVDAAIAVNAVLAVVYPHWCGIGGDGFWLVHDPRRGGVEGLNASGPAARLATRDYYRERGHPEEIPARGPLAALTVPGAVDGWRMAHERFGRLPWEELFADAVRYAREGAPVARSLASWLSRRLDQLAGHSAASLVTGGRGPLREGARVAHPGLADTLERIARRGAREGFYEGETAERICCALQPGGSPLRPEDFAAFRAEWVEPVSTEYRGLTLHELPPNSQGFTALQILNLVEGFDVGAWGDGTADYYHHLAEAVKLALADRDEWLTDPRFVDVPLRRLLSKEYAAERRRLIDPDRALPVGGVAPGIRFGPAARRTPLAGDTCYFCAVDGEGMAASVIQSLYQEFGSMEAGGDTGVILQNRGTCFSLDDRHPNRLEPGKRTFHTLMPAMAFRGGEPYLAFGTMGGNGQAQTHAALVTRIVDFGYDVQQAIEAPRWVVGRTLGRDVEELHLEGRTSHAVVGELFARGHDVRMAMDWDEDMGHAQAIRIHRDTGLLEGGADPRGDGAALGF